MQQQQEQESPMDRTQDRTRDVVARLQMNRRQTISAEFARKQGVGTKLSTTHPTEVRVAPQPQMSAHALKTLVYQARYSTQATLRKEALEGLFLAARFSEATIEALEAALDDKDAQVRETAARQLESFPPPLTDVLLDKLLARIWDPVISVRKAVATTLANHPDPRAIGPLMGLLGTSDLELRSIVHDSLVKITELLGPPPQRKDGEV